ncbi:MAG: hypothetical protein LBT42_01165, partial [Tannerella sp.]|nr:hypothetical protein [Tannerella sp.]
MRKKDYFLASCIASIMLCSTASYGQQGVLLPEKNRGGGFLEHVHDETCNHDHESEGSQLTYEEYLKVMESSLDSITLRRKVHPDGSDTIHGAFDVDSVLGAGESAVLKKQFVTWPLADNDPVISVIHIGSEYSKNAVINIYSNDGEVNGALEEVRMFNETHGGETTNAQFLANTPNTSKPNVSDWYLPHTNANVSQSGSTPAYRVFVDEVKYVPAMDALKNSLVTISTNAATNNTNAFNYLKAQSVVVTTTQQGYNHPYAYPNSFGWQATSHSQGNYAGSVMYPFYNPADDRYYITVHNHATSPYWIPPGVFWFTGDKAGVAYTSTRNTDGTTDDS